MHCDVMCIFLFFFFKQKTAYEMRISDWSSDVCSSDLDYYDPAVKRARIARVVAQGGDLSVLDEDFADWERLETTLGGRDIDRIVHLGAQAGVRYSLVNPHAYEIGRAHV